MRTHGVIPNVILGYTLVSSSCVPLQVTGGGREKTGSPAPLTDGVIRKMILCVIWV